MNLRVPAIGVIVSLLLTIAFILNPGNPYVMAIFTFVAQPLLMISVLMYFQRVFRELRQKDVLNLGLASPGAGESLPDAPARAGSGAGDRSGQAEAQGLGKPRLETGPETALKAQSHFPRSATPSERSGRIEPHPSARDGPMNAHDGAKRVVILGGGFGGVYTALHLQRLTKRDPNVSIALVSRDNYLLMTPLLFEAGSGVLEPRHSVCPIRPLLKKARFVEAEVENIDFTRRVVITRLSADAPPYEMPYDYLVIGLGGVTNLQLIPGSEHAMSFKFLSDALTLRTQIIDLLEWADVETDPVRKRQLLTFVVIGAGLVGVELMGELTEFVPSLCRSYPNVNPEDIHYHLIEAGPKIMPEMDRSLADYSAELLRKRGVEVLMNTPVRSIEPERVNLPEGRVIAADTIMLAAGIAANPVLKDFPLEKDRKGRLMTDGTMRVSSYPRVWAIGDCASIPDPTGTPYPPLAQHAMREAKVLAGNIVADMRGGRSKPFVYSTLGMLASLGHFKGVGRVFNLKIRGFPAWWVWRSYYLMQMPRWERRLRIMLDWTVALVLKNDIVKMDVGQGQPVLRRGLPRAVAPASGVQAAATNNQASGTGSQGATSSSGPVLAAAAASTTTSPDGTVVDDAPRRNATATSVAEVGP